MRSFIEPLLCAKHTSVTLARTLQGRRDLLDPGIEPGSPALQVDSLPTETSREAPRCRMVTSNCLKEPGKQGEGGGRGGRSKNRVQSRDTVLHRGVTLPHKPLLGTGV